MNIEIHRITVEDNHASSSVQGQVSGVSYNGTGSVSGRTDTYHTSSVFANGRTYQLKQSNQQYPFRVEDDLVVACKRNKKTGTYEIGALINLSNGTRLMPSIIMPHILFWGLFLISIPMMILLVGFILAPVALGLGIWYSFFAYPKLKKSYEALAAIAETDPAQIDSQVEQANRLLKEAA